MNSNYAHERGFAQTRTVLMQEESTKSSQQLDYSPLVSDIRSSFADKRTYEYEWRVRELQQMRRMVVENQDKIMQAVQADLRRHPNEAFQGEVMTTVGEIDDTLKNLKAWMADEHVSHPLVMQPGRSRVVRQPKGVALILAPFNYPFYLGVAPLVAAVSAGCAAVIKPSELTPATAKVLEQLIHQYMDPKLYRVVQGAVAETTALLKERWDHIFYTGNGAVGRIVLTAAAKHLTPCTLELGGKSPVYVAPDANLDVTTKRLIQSKFFNNGQTCVAPDYVLVDNKVKDAFIAMCTKNITSFFGQDTSQSTSLARIVNERHWDRINSMVEESHGGKVITPGVAKPNRADKFVPPTLVVDPAPTSRLMMEEIFGPVLPIVGVSGLDEAIQIINSKEHSLASYVFTESKPIVDKFVRETMSGGTCVSDCIFHIANANLPFGGVGSSGMGAYHGRAGFEEFSHRRSVMERDTWLDNAKRYPPLDEKQIDLMRRIIIGPFFSPGTKLALQVGAAGALALALLKPRL